MMWCPVCVKTKLKKEADKLICPDCGYIDPKLAPNIHDPEFIVNEGKFEFELRNNDKLFLNKESFQGTDLQKTIVENIEKLICDEFPFEGSLPAKKFVVEIEFKVKAINKEE